MKEITIEQLRSETERWVSEAAENGGIVITDHGRPIAALTQLASPRRRAWARERLAKLQTMPSISVDSGALVSEDRNRPGSISMPRTSPRATCRNRARRR